MWMVQNRTNGCCIAANLTLPEAAELLWNLTVFEGWVFEIIRQTR